MSTISNPEDKALVERMLAGDETAMEAFGDLYFPALYRFARARLRGDGELARDIVQATVCKALGRLGTYRGEGPLFAWLCGCCRNEIRMYFRRRGAFPELRLDDDGLPPPATGEHGLAARATANPEAQLLHKEAGELVHETLDRLPPHYARALEWKYLDRLSVTDIARRLQLRPKAAESLLTRARTAFRKGYDDRGDEAKPLSPNLATARMPRS